MSDQVNDELHPMLQSRAVAAYLSRIHAKPRTIYSAVVQTQVGRYWKDVAKVTLKLTDGMWEIQAPPELAPNSEELAAIRVELHAVKWPRHTPAYGPFHKDCLPAKYATLPDENLFIFRRAERELEGFPHLRKAKNKDAAHAVVMVQARIENPLGGKSYVPITLWDDGKWRVTEPDVLPIFGVEQLVDTGKRVAFLHEGAKAARAARKISEAHDRPERDRCEEDKLLAAHPWAFDLAGGVHLGWIGGARRVDGTDWSALRTALKRHGIERVVIVADNDQDGREALPEISLLIGMPARHLIFPSSFPASFDFADKMPKVVPSFAESILPGTWLTRIAEIEGKRIPFLADAAKGEWIYVPDAALYVCRDFPWIAYDRDRFNAAVRPLSHTRDVASLIEDDAYAGGRPLRLTYDPGQPSGVVADGEVMALNRFRPASIRPLAGTADPWLDFLKYLFPDEGDKAEMERWCATLVARPGTRMNYSVLLISEAQGVGKSTLGNILSALVGPHNTSYPGQSEIGGRFNAWQSEKRLAVINEVYAGHSWGVYNALKNAVTDQFIDVEKKFQNSYKVKNWLHILACSNSMRALRLDVSDRRWFVPRVTEVKWDKESFEKLHRWLESGGLGHILHWALSRENYVAPGAEAPLSSQKNEVVKAGWSDAARAVAALGDVMAASDRPLAVTVSSLRWYVKGVMQKYAVAEDDQELSRIMKLNGVEKWGRIKIRGTLETVLVNTAAKSRGETEKITGGTGNGAVLDCLQTPDSILPAPM